MSSWNASRVVLIISAALCASITVYILFSHLTSWRDIDSVDLMIAVLLAITASAGHAAFDTDRVKTHRFMLASVFVVGAILSVGMSTSRTTTMWQHSQEQRLSTDSDFKQRIDELDKARSKASTSKDIAATELNAASDEVTRSCKSGDGANCKGAKATLLIKQSLLDLRATDYKEANDAFWQAKRSHSSTQSSEQKMRNFVLLYARIRSISEQDAEPTVLLFLPFLFTIAFELGAIAFTMAAFHHAPLQPVTQSQQPTSHAVTLTQIAKDVGITPAQARAHMRAIGYARPSHGWSFTSTEAESVRSKLAVLH